MISLNWTLITSILIGLGVTTAWTDIKKKKIKNNHLVIFFLLGVIYYIYLFASNQITILPLLQILNGGIALTASFALYYFDIWSAGDSKLVILYSFLIPSGFPIYFKIGSIIELLGYTYMFIVGYYLIKTVFFLDTELIKNVNKKSIFYSLIYSSLLLLITDFLSLKMKYIGYVIAFGVYIFVFIEKKEDIFNINKLDITERLIISGGVLLPIIYLIIYQDILQLSFYFGIIFGVKLGKKILDQGIKRSIDRKEKKLAFAPFLLLSVILITLLNL